MKRNDKYILELTLGEVSRLFHYIPDEDPVTRKIKDSLGKIVSDNTPCTLLSTNNKKEEQ